MSSLNVRFVKNSTKVDKILFTIGTLRNCVNITAGQLTRDVLKKQSVIDTNRGNTVVTHQSSRSLTGSMAPYSREFHIMDYDIIGFDLDGTLLRYNLNNMVPLEYKILSQFLVNERNYPLSLLKRKFDEDFLQKGLVIDAERGNLLKLGDDGTILKATHGTQLLNEKEILEVYGKLRKWDVAQEYIKDPLSAWNGPIAEKLRTLLDYFDLGASLVFAQAVDVIDETWDEYRFGKKYKIWPDILAGLIQMYAREKFTTGESAYFESIKKSPDKYLLKTDEKVIDLLKQLKASGKALFLLTGSNIDFANFTATYALGKQWQNLFDYTIAFAKKPGFFYLQRPFLKVSNLKEIEGSEMSLTDILTPSTCYSQGNWQQLKESLCKCVLRKNHNKVRSLYIGDNLIQDIYAPNAVAYIDTLALSEELLENDNNYGFKSMVQSSLWGSYFSDEGKPTLWSKIIEEYSQACVSHMEVVTEIIVKEKIYKNKAGVFPKLPGL